MRRVRRWRRVRLWRRKLTLTACGLAGLALAGCGGSTTTVTVSSAPPTQTQTAGHSATTTSSTPRTTSTAANVPAPTTSTRTAPSPSFTEHHASAGQQATAAAAIVQAHGYTPKDTSEYHSNQTLAVLLGTRTGSGDGHSQQAFFFVDGKYIGTDASQPSATLKVVSQSDTAVTLAYPLYRSKDPLCCPSGGQAQVTFQLNNGKLAPLGPIPPASSSTGLSRQ